jgi:hypothetical protein
MTVVIVLTIETMLWELIEKSYPGTGWEDGLGTIKEAPTPSAGGEGAAYFQVRSFVTSVIGRAAWSTRSMTHDLWTAKKREIQEHAWRGKTGAPWRIRPLSLVGVDIGLPAASPADALLKVGLFLPFVGAGSGSNPLSRGGKRLARPEGFEPPAA